MTTERKPWYVECGDCGHQWIGYYMPMDSSKVADVMLTLRCPMCGSRAVRELGKGHYRVAVESPGCKVCGHDAFFDIVSGFGDDERAQGQSWNDRELAQDICDLMNSAFEEGKRARE